MYRKYKTEIKEVRIYDNRISSQWLFRARSNSLKVNQRAYFFKPGYKEEDKICGLCKKEEESLEHFILKCKNLGGKRNKELIKKIQRTEWKRNSGTLIVRDKGR